MCPSPPSSNGAIIWVGKHNTRPVISLPYARLTVKRWEHMGVWSVYSRLTEESSTPISTGSFPTVFKIVRVPPPHTMSLHQKLFRNSRPESSLPYLLPNREQKQGPDWETLLQSSFSDYLIIALWFQTGRSASLYASFRACASPPFSSLWIRLLFLTL